jgi:folylpolyglutamate synthase/dihydropteroate synthase
VTTAGSIVEALNLAFSSVRSNGLVVVTGSVYVVGEALAALQH